MSDKKRMKLRVSPEEALLNCINKVYMQNMKIRAQEQLQAITLRYISPSLEKPIRVKKMGEDAEMQRIKDLDPWQYAKSWQGQRD